MNAQVLLKMCEDAVRRMSRMLALPLVLAATLALAGCGTAPWARGATRVPTASPTAMRPAPVHDDLSGGSLKHRLAAGGVTLDVSYWSTLKPAQWSPAADKPLFVSFVGDAGSPVYASSVTMTAVAYRGDTQVSTKPISITDAATVQPGYVIASPYSYTGLFTLPPVPGKATSVRVQFAYVVLQAAQPTGGYAKSTTTDTLTIALAP